MESKRLQQGEIEAWTYLLRSEKALSEATVVGVERQPLTPQSTRFLLTLAGQSEPIVLTGRDTTVAEARFYQDFGDMLAGVLPRCWLAEEDPLQQAGWLVLEDVGQHHPPHTWDLQDVERLGKTMAQVHATFWGINPQKVDWLPHKPDLPVEKVVAGPAGDLFDPFLRSWSRLQSVREPGRATPMRSNLINHLVSPTQIAALHHRRPDLLSDVDAALILQLLDHPETLLRPLLTMPLTVLHGAPQAANWRLTLFDDCYLINWQQAAAGPAMLDLAQLLIHVLELHRTIALGEDQADDAVEELLVDSYFIHLSLELHERFGYQVTYSSRYLRRYALPAALCWTLLPLLRRSEPNDDQAGSSRLKTLLPNLLQACRLLTTP